MDGIQARILKQLGPDRSQADLLELLFSGDEAAHTKVSPYVDLRSLRDMSPEELLSIRENISDPNSEDALADELMWQIQRVLEARTEN